MSKIRNALDKVQAEAKKLNARGEVAADKAGTRLVANRWTFAILLALGILAVVIAVVLLK